MNQNLHFPDKLIIRLADAVTKLSIPKLTVMLTIFAKRKNNYLLYKVSPDIGLIKIACSEMRTSTIKDRNLFLMDYGSTLEECEPQIKIEICSVEHVSKLIGGFEAFREYWKDEIDFMNAVKASRNDLYRPTSVTVVLDEPAVVKFVEIFVERISDSSDDE